MQIKTLQRSLLAAVLASALFFSCADKEEKKETEVKTTEEMSPAPVIVPDTATVMDTGVVKPVVPTTPK